MYRAIVMTLLTALILSSLCACKNNNVPGPTEITELTEDIPVTTATSVAKESVPNIGDWNDENTMSMIDFSEYEDEVQSDSATIGVESTTESVENTKPVSNVEETIPLIPTEPTSSLSPEETEAPVQREDVQQLTEYEKYIAMSGEEQMAFMQSFDTIEAFFVWLNNAKAEYEAANPAIEIGNGEIDIGAIIGK